MPKAKKEKAGKPLRHNPLAAQIKEEEDERGLRMNPRTKAHRGSKGDIGGEDESVPANLTKKVLDLARSQKLEEDGDAAVEIDFEEDDLGGGDGDDEDGEVCDVEVDEDGFVVAGGATEEEEKALSLFLPSAGKGKPQGPTLADIILEKIQQHEGRRGQDDDSDVGGAAGPGMSPKVIEVYGEIGTWLSHYKSGKLPKAFKVIPSLVNWEEVLSLTKPLGWSPAAMYEAVSIFASSLNPRMAQRFFNLVLLPAVRQNIAEHKKLNFHYYRALRKSIFKPAAFFKGIVLPFATENCTLREALILASVLAKASIPPLHVAATIVRMCAMTPWYGTTSILLAALCNKKCALPLRVIDTLVSHFYAFSREERALPLVWHRSLLIFVQRYKFDLSTDQRKYLKEVLQVHFHPAVGEEIRKELNVAKAGGAGPAQTVAVAMDTS